MRCKYESFGCYYVSIHSPPPSGSSAIRGGKNVYCEKVDLESRRLFSITCGVFSRTYVYPMAQPLLLFIFFFFLTPCPPCLFHLVFSSNTQFLHWFLLPLILSSSDTSTLYFILFFSWISPPTCLTELCPVPCGSHGVCSEGQCQCEEGWIGAACDQRACHPRCEEHGQCHDGTCICQPGWEGEHCNIGELRVCVCVCVHMGVFNYAQ